MNQIRQIRPAQLNSNHQKLSLLRNIYNSHRLYVLPVLIVLCTLFYYFGELIDWAAWNTIRSNFFYGVHDVHRLVFLAPIIYASYYGRIRGAIIITLITFMIFLPRAFFISPYPDPFLRMIFFTIIAGVVGVLIGDNRNKLEKYVKLETQMQTDRAALSAIANNISDGVMIIGPDYIIRFTNVALTEFIGVSNNKPCYEQLYQRDSPCQQCTIAEVINENHMMMKNYNSKGTNFNITSAPYTDVDGITCQLSIFQKLS